MSDRTVVKDWLAKLDTDLAFLMECFREVLTKLGETELASSLPWLEDTGSADTSNSTDLGARELQVLSIAFQLLNLVEENAAAQARRTRENLGALVHEPGLWGQNLRQLKELGFTAGEIAAVLPQIQVEIVLTAHPTEAKRPIVLKHHRTLYQALSDLENTNWTQTERESIREDIQLVLERLWRTGEMYLYKPDVSSELDHVIDYLRSVFPSVLNMLDKRLRVGWREAGLDLAPLDNQECAPALRFGNWVGGDRDGHPLVTAEVTRRTLERLRATALDIVGEELQRLYENLAMSEQFQQAPEFFTTAIENLVERFGDQGQAVVAANPLEPWRQYVYFLRLRLPGESKARCYYRRPDELLADLGVLKKSLTAIGATRLAEEDVRSAERLVEVFGFHGAALDIRQNSAFYETALVELLTAAGLDGRAYAAMDAGERAAFLTKELESPRPLAPRGARLGDKASAVIDCFQVVADYLATYGPGGIGAFVVSMTRNVSDLLTVYVLAREVGLVHPGRDGLVSDIHVTPLFETTDDLEASPEILREFLAHGVTRRSLARQPRSRPVQQVMIGYSDSNKVGGLFSANWHLNRGQKMLVAAASEFDVELEFFHGRGGTVSRGAGPTHRFLGSLPHGSLQSHFRLTEQGEIIAQKYGNPATAAYNLELLLAGVTATALKHRTTPPETDLPVDMATQLNAYSSEAYSDLLKGQYFLGFWKHATPIDALEHSNIGSRPARRTGRQTLDDLRAIPWVFSWSQARYYLPGWYGLGSALERFAGEDAGHIDLLRKYANGNPFLRYVLYNAETSLASADLDIMYAYAELVPDASIRDRFYNLIAEEYRRTDSMINEIFGGTRAQRRPRMKKTLDMREDGLHRLHTIQIRLLREWRQRKADNDTKGADAMLPSLLLSINAIASGLRTTG